MQYVWRLAKTHEVILVKRKKKAQGMLRSLLDLLGLSLSRAADWLQSGPGQAARLAAAAAATGAGGAGSTAAFAAAPWDHHRVRAQL